MVCWKVGLLDDRWMDEWVVGWMGERVEGRKNGFIKGLMADGWRERLTDSSVIIFSNNLTILFPL